MKYAELDLGTIEAVFNKLGGMDGARRFLRNELVVSEPVARVIKIDRTKPFNPADFIGSGWMIDEPQDERSLALDEMDLIKVRFETMLKSGEPYITGEEKLKRLKAAGHVRLDAKIFQTLWENQSLIPESWKEKIDGNTRYIFFDGTVLRSPGGRRCVLYLCWYDGRWRWCYSWLDNSWSVSSPSAVLAS